MNPSTAEYVKAFQALREKINGGQLKMLQAHYAAESREMTAHELAEAAGYKSFNAANVHYGRLGRLLHQELGGVPPHLWTQMIADGPTSIT